LLPGLLNALTIQLNTLTTRGIAVPTHLRVLVDIQEQIKYNFVLMDRQGPLGCAQLVLPLYTMVPTSLDAGG
jgi:hypothetical protein